MSATETVLYLVAVPAGIVLIVFALVFAGGARREKRYRPGRPYEFTPVWYVANHSRADAGGGGSAPGQLTARPDQPGPGGLGVIGPGHEFRHGATGGASDRW